MIDENKLLDDFEKKIYPEKFGERCNALDVINAVLQLIDEQPKIGDWIQCDERLPNKENEKVIASAIWDGYAYSTESYFHQGKFYNKPYYQVLEKERSKSYTGDKVIAWQPFPQPYKS